jgi:hypothetical protein
MRALYQVLTGDDRTSALAVVAGNDAAELAELSDRFIAALVDVRNAWARDGQGVIDEIAGRWATAATWPTSMKLRGLSSNRLLPRALTAAEARKSGLPVYCWRGPAVPAVTIVVGHAD